MAEIGNLLKHSWIKVDHRFSPVFVSSSGHLFVSISKVREGQSPPFVVTNGIRR